MRGVIKLNLGCGAIRPQGWINTDSSLNMLVQRIPLLRTVLPKLLHRRVYESGSVVYMNLAKPWARFAADSVDVVYSSHVLEHLPMHSAALFLDEAFRCLTPGGVIRVVVPDLYRLCRNYVDAYEAEGAPAADALLWAINMHREGQYPAHAGWARRLFLEWQGYPHQHKYMYDAQTLTRLFSRAGFVEMQEQRYGRSALISDILEVEAGEEPYLSVYLEARKPGP